MDSLIVPSSIQRIRSFLVEMCGMKVKPWASSEETLAALHATLVARQGYDVFWTSLRALLETLARDLEARQQAAPGALIDNEILSAERYATLLDEIRACLAKQQSEHVPSFRRLAQGLSAPALGLLLLLGGVATVGCDSSSLRASRNAPEAAVADTRPSQPDSASAQPDATADSAPDNGIHITVPDAAPARNDANDAKEAASSGPDGAAVTIQEIMDSCNIPSTDQAVVLACLSSLRESWTTGIASYLAGRDCNVVSNTLGCNASYSPCNYAFPSGAEFSPSLLPLCRPVVIYLGVSFV